MGLLTKESLQELRQRVDLIDVISGHIDLKRAGASYKACCPFHEEKTPSFVVNRGDDHYHCFGCGAHGDAIEFLMNFLHMSFTEAVEALAQRFGISLRREAGGKREEETGPDRVALREALGKAAEIYHTLLLHTEEGHVALQYLYARGLDIDFIRRFKVGWAPVTAGMVRNALNKEGFADEVLAAAGLLNKGGKEFFQERVLFPIRDPMGAVIGFSGRKIREEVFGGKYINTPETKLFRKSQVLFGLDQCRRKIAKERKAIVVEGQIDALRIIHAGLELAVAGQGTAFGEGHAEALIKLGVNQVYLAMDGDRAGLDAAYKVGDLFQKRGVGVKVVRFAQGCDPDSVLSAGGLDGLVEHLKKADEYLPFAVQMVGAEVDTTTPAGKGELVRRLTAQIRKWEDPVMVHESLRQLAYLAGVPEDVVGVGTRPRTYMARSGGIGKVAVDPNVVLEADCLRWLMGKPEKWMVELARSHLQPEDFCVPLFRKLYPLLPADLLEVAGSLESETEQAFVSRMLERKVNKERAKELFPQAILKVLERNWMASREAIRQKMESEGDEEEMLELVKEFDLLTKNPPEVTL